MAMLILWLNYIAHADAAFEIDVKLNGRLSSVLSYLIADKD